MPAKGTSWYCDIVAVNFRERAVYLCEVTYNKKLDALITRLQAWGDNWAGVRAALIRDCAIPETWDIKPWVFVPQDRDSVLRTKLSSLRNVGDGNGKMPTPRIEHLEAVLPWKYRSWDRNGNDSA
jgi:hypothetical protein